MPPTTSLVSAADVCQLLRCSRSTLWRRINDGTIPPPLKLGRLSRWRLSDIEAAIENAAGEIPAVYQPAATGGR